MLRSMKELRDYVLAAEDGQIGRCKDFLFDDTSWTVRYMVADTGKWLPGRKVLISPITLGKADWQSQLLPVRMTKKEIEESPSVTSDAPVSREFERQWYEHYNWTPYWHGGSIWGADTVPQSVATYMGTQTATAENREEPSHNLRSSEEVRGYHIRATDGEIGHVEDFIIDDRTWAIRYIVVDTRNWLPGGRKVLVSPAWVEKVEWADRRVHIDLGRDPIKKGPEYEPGTPVNREHEARLYDYYGRPKYWE